MKILHLLSQTILTGAEAYAIELSDELVKQGHPVWICSDTLHLPTTAQTLLKPIHDRAKWAETEDSLNQLIADQNIQILHTHSRSSTKLAKRLCKTHPQLCHIHTFHGLQKPALSKRLINSFGDTNIFVCENIQSAMRSERIRYAKHNAIIRNGIRLRHRAEAKKSLGIDSRSRPLKVGIISRLSNLKGQRTLQVLRGTTPLLQRHPLLEIHLYAGDFESLSEADQMFLRTLEKEYPSRFIYQGFAKNLSGLFSEFDLVCGGGRIAAEALMQEIPVFAFGESCSIGFVNSENLQDALNSNFGDIKHNAPSQPWPLNDLTYQFEACIQNLLQKQDPPHLAGLDPDFFQKVQREFSFEENIAQIILMYRQTMGRKLHKNYTPLLMYHKVVSETYETAHKIFVLADDFEKHLQFYKAQGFSTLHFKDYQRFRDGRLDPKTYPKRPLMITFDDGYLNNLEIALPLLEKYQMKATVFLLANNDIQTNRWDSDQSTTEPGLKKEKEFPLMNAEQRLIFSKHPLIEIGSHGFSHAPLSSLGTQAERLSELQLSKKSLEQELQCEIVVFAYTYGTRTPDASALGQLAGYHFAVNTDTGGLHIEDDPWSAFRVSMFPHETRWSLWKKTRGFYRKYYHWKRNK
jgi:peptidoglycan/xylan/chitin deacetylase (PgdA/CDA1 family)